MKRRGIVLVIVALAGVAGVLLWRSWPQPAQRSSGTPAAAPPLVYGSPAGYVGNEQCAKCHREISEKFARTEMGGSWSPVASAPIIEQDGEVIDAKSGLHYEIDRRDDRLFVRETLSDETGETIHDLEVEAHFIVGSGLHGRSYATELNGYISMLPVGWYSDAGKWALSPGYEQTNQRFDRPLTSECAGCHNAEPTFIAGSRNRYELPMPSGIGCERCHGPGAVHAAKQRAAMQAGEAMEKPDASIVNPARLSADLQQDVCLQCHLLSDIPVLQPGKRQFEFRPGKRLRDFRSDFFTTEQTGDRPGSVGHVSRSMNSKCFTASGGRMTCALCHDPHVPLKEIPAGQYNARCADCHQERECNRPLKAGQSARDGDCVACHMPRVASANIGHAVTTEHLIRRRPEISSEAPQPPPSPLPLGFWGDESDIQLGSALVVGHDYIDNPVLLDKAVKLLEKEMRRNESTEIMYRLALGHFHLRRWTNAVAALQDVLRRAPDDTDARALLGLVYARMGRSAEAVIEYEETLRRNPHFAGADVDLSLLYFDAQQPDRLVAIFEKVMHQHPPNPFVLALTAKAQLMLGKDVSVANALVERAKPLNPFVPAPFFLEAQLATDSGDVSRAERALRAAIRAQDSFLPAHLGLGELLVRSARYDEATECYRKILEFEPGNGIALRALEQLKAGAKVKRN